MTSFRKVSPSVLVAVTAAIAALGLGSAACGGTTQFASAQPVLIAGTPPPPPPVAEKPADPPKPPPRVELRDNKIEFKEKIQFEVNKAVIKEESFSLLHDIAEVIKQNPQVKRLSIEGHASAEGDAKKNKTLSDDRAKSVADHLVKKENVEAARLLHKGWGVEKPIADNATEDGREKNRRVEFLVVEQSVTSKTVHIDPTTGKEKVVNESTKSLVHPDHTEAPAGTAAKGSDPKKAADTKAADPKKATDTKAADPKKTETPK